MADPTPTDHPASVSGAQEGPSAEALEAASKAIGRYLTDYTYRTDGLHRDVAQALDAFAAQAVAATEPRKLSADMRALLQRCADQFCYYATYYPQSECLRLMNVLDKLLGKNDREIVAADRASRHPFHWFHPSRWRHKKRGTSYTVLTATAEAQCATGPINEGDHVTVYQDEGEHGNWYIRKTDEFQDGRFDRIDLTEGWPQC